MRPLISGGVVVTCDQDWRVHTDGDLVLDDDLLLYAGPRYGGEYDARVSPAGRMEIRTHQRPYPHPNDPVPWAR